jgi:hypothetical protein
MKILQLLSIFILLAIWSCGSDPKPTVVYPKETSGEIIEKELKLDTTLILVGELPIYFDSTDYILFPVGQIRVNSGGGSKIYFGSGSSGDESLSIGYLSGTKFTGNLNNIRLQHIDSANFRPINQSISQNKKFSIS